MSFIFIVKMCVCTKNECFVSMSIRMVFLLVLMLHRFSLHYSAFNSVFFFFLISSFILWLRYSPAHHLHTVETFIERASGSIELSQYRMNCDRFFAWAQKKKNKKWKINVHVRYEARLLRSITFFFFFSQMNTSSSSHHLK